MASQVQFVTGRDEIGQPANVGVGMDDNGLLVLSSPGANLASGSDILRQRLRATAREKLGPAAADALSRKLLDVVVDHFMKLGAREVHLDPDAAVAYQKLLRAVNSAW